MTLMELGTMLNAQIVIRSRPHMPNRRWYASFERGEKMESGMLVGAIGNGDSPDAALLDYIRQIRGVRLAFDATSERRWEFDIPQTLEGIGP